LIFYLIISFKYHWFKDKLSIQNRFSYIGFHFNMWYEIKLDQQLAVVNLFSSKPNSRRPNNKKTRQRPSEGDPQLLLRGHPLWRPQGEGGLTQVDACGWEERVSSIMMSKKI